MEELLNSIKMKYQYVDKSKETAGNRYKVTLSKGNHEMTFDYHTNMYDEVNLKEVLECLMIDNLTMQMMYPNYWTVDCFRREFAYSEDHKTDKELKSIMKMIERNSVGLQRLFNAHELNLLAKLVD